MGICRRDFTRWMVAGLPLASIRAAWIRPKLLVLVVLEQLSGDLLDSVVPQFTPNGLKKLLYKGAQFADCRHSASTFSSTTLATLATGAWPSQHGIVADSWLEKAAVTPASAEALLATTLAAQVTAEPKGRAF